MCSNQLVTIDKNRRQRISIYLSQRLLMCRGICSVKSKTPHRGRGLSHRQDMSFWNAIGNANQDRDFETTLFQDVWSILGWQHFYRIKKTPRKKPVVNFNRPAAYVSDHYEEESPKCKQLSLSD